MRLNRSFTLTEMLVVIAVIGILAGLLLPTLHHSKEYAYTTTCINNLKQWGDALHVYAADHGDFLPPEGWANPKLPSHFVNGWYVQLPQVLRIPPLYGMPWRTDSNIYPHNSVWICPSNPRRSNGYELFHYCLNEYVDGTGANDQPTTLSAVPRPSDVVYLFDSKNEPAIGSWTFVHTNLHTGGANFLFLDSHVVRLKAADYWDPVTQKAITNNPSIVWIPQ